MKRTKIILSILVTAFFLAACNNNNVDFKKTSAGVPYKIFSNGKGDSIHPNYIVKFQVIQKIKDSILFNSYKENAPQFLQLQPVPLPVRYDDIQGNIIEIMTKARKGDSIYMALASDSILKANPQAAAKLKPGEQLVTTFKIVEVYKNPEEAKAAVTKEKLATAEQNDKKQLAKFSADTMVQSQMKIDNKIIEDYLAAHHIQTQKTPWGVYVQVINAGQEPKPANGKYVNVKYSGAGLDGKVFDAGTYPIQIGMGGSIKGFEEAVKLLGKGGKAKAYIPSMLGYGPQGSEPKIKPNQVLVFDLEVLDISDIQPVQQQLPTNIDSTKKQK